MYKRCEIPERISYYEMENTFRKQWDKPDDLWNYTLFDGAFYRNLLTFEYPVEVDEKMLEMSVNDLTLIPQKDRIKWIYVPTKERYFLRVPPHKLQRKVDLRVLNLDNYDRSGRMFSSLEEFLEWADHILNQDIIKYSDYVCQKCKFVCRSETQLKNHVDSLNCIRRQEMRKCKEANTVFVPDSEKPIYCECCQVLISNKYIYQKHIKTKKHLRNKKSSIKFPLTCEICKQVYPDRKKFVRHLKQAKKCHKLLNTEENKAKWHQYYTLCGCKFTKK